MGRLAQWRALRSYRKYQRALIQWRIDHEDWPQGRDTPPGMRKDPRAQVRFPARAYHGDPVGDALRKVPESDHLGRLKGAGDAGSRSTTNDRGSERG